MMNADNGSVFQLKTEKLEADHCINSESISLSPDKNVDEEMEEKPKSMSHQEALAFVEAGILDLIHSDPLLRDLPPGVTLEELNSLLALQQGRAMTVIIRKGDDDTYAVVVEQDSRVIDLKKAIQKHVNLKLAREGCDRTVSWRYTWKTYWLYFEGQKLVEDHKLLKDYGVQNNSELTFIKILRNR